MFSDTPRVPNDHYTQLQDRLAARIRERRTALKLTQDDLAWESEVDRAYVSLLEGSKAIPTLQVMSKLAVALKTDLGNLLAGVDD